jgi:TrmH family RNA methyltransferase
MHEKQRPRPLSSHDVLAHVHALLDNRTLRDSTRRFCIEGVRQFIQAYEAKLTFDTILHSRLLLRSAMVRKQIAHLESTGVRRISLSPEQFRRISTTEHASGVAGIVRQHWTSFQRLDPRRGRFYLVIESLRSPGNLGTILRTAEATGAGGVIFLGPRGDPFDPRVVRASMGGIFHLKLIRTSPHALRGWCREHGVQIVGLHPRATHLWTQVSTDRPIALLLGEERAGISTQAAGLCDHSVRLPMTGRADSLNVAVAAGVMMYEMVRKRGRVSA